MDKEQVECGLHNDGGPGKERPGWTCRDVIRAALALVAGVALWHMGRGDQGWALGSGRQDLETARAGASGEARTDRPIIGVLTVPVEADSHCVSRRRALRETKETSCFSSTYALWLQAAGARVVPIRYDLPPEEIDRLMSSVNGLFLTGGDVEIREHPSKYMEAAAQLLAFAVESNLNGTVFPLWGTCMGLQTLSVLIGGDQVLEYHQFEGVDGIMLPLELTERAADSKLFGTGSKNGNSKLLAADVRQWFQTENVTVNYHHDGVAPETYEENEKLAAFFDVLSTNVDAKGKRFASTIEARDFPIYAVQYHPERPQFQFLPEGKDPVNHGTEAVACNSYLAQNFVADARQNSRRFPSAQEEHRALIENFSKRGSFTSESYFFTPHSGDN